jgi:hypothetical protein
LLAYEAGLIESVFDESKMEMQFGRHTRFDKSSLIRLVESQGFRVLAFGTYFVKPFTHEQMEKLLDWRILDQSVIQGLERMISYMPDMGCEMFVELTKRE